MTRQRRTACALMMGLALNACSGSAAAQDPPAVEGRPGDAGPLVPIAEGRWEVFSLPVRWLKEHWKAGPIDALYIALSGPAGRSFDDDQAPCFAPAHLVATVLRAGKPPQDIVLETYAFCTTATSDRTRRGWPQGPRGFVTGLSIRPYEDGRIEITQSFGRHVDDSYPVDRNPAAYSRPVEPGSQTQAVRVLQLAELYRRLK
jgi:hypothetical protein